MLAKDLKCIFSDKRTFILLVIILLLGIVGVLFSVGNDTEPMIKLGIADMDNTEYSQLLVTYFDENKEFTSYIKIYRGSDVELTDMFNRGELDCCMVIPLGFANGLMEIQNQSLKVLINSADATKAVLLTNMMGAYGDYVTGVQMTCQALIDKMKEEGYERKLVNDVNFEVSLDLVMTALDKSSYFERKEVERFKGISLINYFIYSAIVLIVLYGGMFAGLNALRERLGKAGERLKSLGISEYKIVVSKLVAYSLVYSAFMIFLMLIMRSMGDIEIPVITFILIIPVIIGAVLLFLVISNLVKTVNSYTVVSNMLILLMTIAGGGVIPIMYMPEVCVRVAGFTPTYWFIRIICAGL